MATIGYAQFRPEFGEAEANLARAEEMIRRAAGADLLVLPELATTGYDFKDQAEVRRLAEPFSEGPTGMKLKSLAAELEITLVMGYAELDDGGRTWNSAILATPAGRMVNYRKIHLFDREKELFQPGEEPPPVVDTPLGPVGLMICFDWLFPETARLLALGGARIIAHPSNLVLQYCQRAMFARSVENGLFTITANRIGTEERAGRSLTFTGASQVTSPKGEVLVSAPDAEEHLGLARVQPEEADDKQITAHNHRLGDRRPGLYGGLWDDGSE